jgi:hypothetical protein
MRRKGMGKGIRPDWDGGAARRSDANEGELNSLICKICRGGGAWHRDRDREQS